MGGGVWLLVGLGFLLLRFSQGNKKAAESGFTLVPPQSSLLQARGCEAEGWSGDAGVSYASTSRPDPWRGAASVAVNLTMSPLSLSFNKVVFLLLEPSIWDCQKKIREVQHICARLLLRVLILHDSEQQRAGQV